VDIGSSFLPSDIIAAYLFAQLENLDAIQNRRKEIWQAYFDFLSPIAAQSTRFSLPVLPDYATNNAHMFYLVCDNVDTRTALIKHLFDNGVHAVFHYLSLHESAFYKEKYVGDALVHSDKYTDCVLRLPLFYELTDEEVSNISGFVTEFFNLQK
jgi:dTDP-4-amino-4,6-dideoxygalactose transaminase